MNLTHHKWNKSGRTFKTEKPNQFVYKSRVGQKNVEISPDEYIPYIWDSENNFYSVRASQVETIFIIPSEPMEPPPPPADPSDQSWYDEVMQWCEENGWELEPED